MSLSRLSVKMRLWYQVLNLPLKLGKYKQGKQIPKEDTERSMHGGCSRLQRVEGGSDKRTGGLNPDVY